MTPVDYLFSLEMLGIKLGLDNIRRLLADLDHPDRAFHSIVIAGTNGKGSVAAMLERALRAAGWRTGLYTSPHLIRLNERFAIDGQAVDDEAMRAGAEGIRHAARKINPPPTFFEATTALACELFRTSGVDVAVMEVGLGGRLDATNALEPVATAITAVDFDHQAHLGSTIEQIAAEKAGIIKTGVPVVLGANPAEVRDVVRRIAADRRAPLVDAAASVDVESTFDEGRLTLTMRTHGARYGPVTLGLRGRHQRENATTLVALAEAIDRHTAIGVPASAIETGLRDVEWPARLQMLTWHGTPVLVDAAHNPSGARALAAYVSEVHGRAPFVFAAMQDKDIEGVLAPLVPVMASLTLTRPSTPRAASLESLAATAARVAPVVPVTAMASPAAAVEQAARDAAVRAGAPVVVAGSLYLAGDVLAALS